MTHTTKHTRHFEIGEFVVFDTREGHVVTEAGIREIIGYAPDGLALMIYPHGLMGLFKSRKEAQEATGWEPRRCTLAGMVAWQGIYSERCADLTGIDDLGLQPPAQNQLLRYEPKSAREKQSAN